jgi:hypothetical protein
MEIHKGEIRDTSGKRRCSRKSAEVVDRGGETLQLGASSRGRRIHPEERASERRNAFERRAEKLAVRATKKRRGKGGNMACALRFFKRREDGKHQHERHDEEYYAAFVMKAACEKAWIYINA